MHISSQTLDYYFTQKNRLVVKMTKMYFHVCGCLTVFWGFDLNITGNVLTAPDRKYYQARSVEVVISQKL